MVKGARGKKIDEGRLNKFNDWANQVKGTELKRGELMGKAVEFNISPPAILKLAKKAGLKLPGNKKKGTTKSGKKAVGRPKGKSKTKNKGNARTSNDIIQASGVLIIQGKSQKAIVKAIGKLSNELENLKKSLGM